MYTTFERHTKINISDTGQSFQTLTARDTYLTAICNSQQLKKNVLFFVCTFFLFSAVCGLQDSSQNDLGAIVREDKTHNALLWHRRRLQPGPGIDGVKTCHGGMPAQRRGVLFRPRSAP